MGFPGEYGDSAALPEAAVSLTMKSGKGYDADMLTIRGMDYDEFVENAVALLGTDVLERKLAGLRKVPEDDRPAAPAQNRSQPAGNTGGGGYSGGGGRAPQNASQPPAQPTQAQPSGGQAPAGGGDWKANAPQCEHGRRRAQEWTARSGPQAGQKQYSYFCPLGREVPMSDKCTPIDAVNGKEWGA